MASLVNLITPALYQLSISPSSFVVFKFYLAPWLLTKGNSPDGLLVISIPGHSTLVDVSSPVLCGGLNVQATPQLKLTLLHLFPLLRHNKTEVLVLAPHVDGETNPPLTPEK